DDWGQIEGQHSDPSKDRVLVEPMIDAFGQRFHLTIAVEGDDCEVNRDAFWIRAWYTVSEAFAKYPPAAGKLNITLNVVAAARDITVAVDDSGSNFTITAPRDFDSKDWGDKFERPFRKNAKSL
ncbi:MAG: hypothetical protein NT062_25945, partial [Proteobacteria bacterium]|nr:hypothetical protein [Pseudomonadota bacterium]